MDMEVQARLENGERTSEDAAEHVGLLEVRHQVLDPRAPVIEEVVPPHLLLAQHTPIRLLSNIKVGLGTNDAV